MLAIGVSRQNMMLPIDILATDNLLIVRCANQAQYLFIGEIQFRNERVVLRLTVAKRFGSIDKR